MIGRLLDSVGEDEALVDADQRKLNLVVEFKGIVGRQVFESEVPNSFREGGHTEI